MFVINRQLHYLQNKDGMFLWVVLTLYAIKSHLEDIKFSVVNQPSLVASVTGVKEINQCF